MGNVFSQLLNKALQGTGRARGMGRGFAGRAPRNFSPLGQAPRTASPVPRQLGVEGVIQLLALEQLNLLYVHLLKANNLLEANKWV